VECPQIGAQRAEYLACQATLQAADDLHFGETFLHAPLDVCASARVVTQARCERCVRR
jgi:hypothetical protein